ncbi:MAG: GntR family transcriptional regulator [Tateyamaria sp.]|uniref:GntR family transcriptional regulator n=1 Tax=Tateyamaria sp. TaxID=1929288 RepID=UPI0032A0181D
MAKPKQTASVTDTIIAWIDRGDLLPGGQIDEKHLMDICGVSRTPVREALIQLEADGLMVRHPRKGIRVFEPTVEEFLSILELHANLEAHATELAALRISPTQKTELAHAVNECRDFASADQAGNHTEYYALNMRFHEVITLASANPFLIDLIKLNARKLMAYYRLRYRTPSAIETSVREHVTIAEYILNHDVKAARQAMADHFNYDRETVMHMIASVR